MILRGSNRILRKIAFWHHKLNFNDKILIPCQNHDFMIFVSKCFDFQNSFDNAATDPRWASLRWWDVGRGLE